jgi:diacylglycerol kinase (ATP)
MGRRWAGKHHKMRNPTSSNEIKRIIKAFGYSVEGLKAALGESAFRTEIIISAIAIPFAFKISHNATELALLIGSLLLVLIVELLNTGLELTINRISLDIHPLSKKVKDIASAAVLLAIINAIIIWSAVLWS